MKTQSMCSNSKLEALLFKDCFLLPSLPPPSHSWTSSSSPVLKCSWPVLTPSSRTDLLMLKGGSSVGIDRSDHPLSSLSELCSVDNLRAAVNLICPKNLNCRNYLTVDWKFHFFFSFFFGLYLMSLKFWFRLNFIVVHLACVLNSLTSVVVMKMCYWNKLIFFYMYVPVFVCFYRNLNLHLNRTIGEHATWHGTSYFILIRNIWLV